MLQELHRVGVEGNALAQRLGLSFDRSGQLCNGLHGADLVVGVHDAHQHRAGGQRGPQRFRVHQAVGVHREVGDLEAELLQELAGVEHAVVFDSGGDDVVAPLLGGEGDALDGGVVRLAAAAGEDDLVGAAIQDAGHREAGLVHGLAGLLSQAVDTGGVAEFPGEVGHHRFQHFRRTAWWRRGRGR